MSAQFQRAAMAGNSESNLTPELRGAALMLRMKPGTLRRPLERLVRRQGREVGVVTQDFPIIRMGLGKVEVGDAEYEGLPALWFGVGGRGLDAPVQQLNRPAHDGETLVLFTFADIRGLEAIENACARLRATMTPNTK